jgi:hypothetical protein
MSFDKVGAILMFLIGIYLVSVTIYNIVNIGNQAGWIMNGLVAAVGGAMIYYSWSRVRTLFA